jgi:site-specific recombinase XerD
MPNDWRRNLRKRGRYWQFDFQWKNKRFQGSTGHTNKEEAQKWLRAYRTNLVNTGVGLVQQEPPPVLSVFLNGAFTKHTEQENTPATAYIYRKKIRQLEKFPPFTVKRLDEITENEIRDYKTWRLAQKRKISTINGDLRCLRKALRYADKCRLIHYGGVSTLPGEASRMFVLSGELEKEYLAAADYPLKQIAILMLDLGLRPDEAVSLRKSSISDFPSTVAVLAGKTVNAKRTLPQTKRTIEAFAFCAAVFPDSEWVFPGRKPGTHLTRTRVSMAHIELREGHPDWPKEFLLYSLRHSFGSRLAESGAQAFEICALMGHSSVKVSEKYIHLSSDHLGTAMKRLEAYGRVLRGEEVGQPHAADLPSR